MRPFFETNPRGVYPGPGPKATKIESHAVVIVGACPSLPTPGRAPDGPACSASLAGWGKDAYVKGSMLRLHMLPGLLPMVWHSTGPQTC